MSDHNKPIQGDSGRSCIMDAAFSDGSQFTYVTAGVHTMLQAASAATKNTHTIRV